MENKLIELDEGKYVVKVQAMKKLENDTSAMDPYLGENCIVTNESGEIFLTLVINEEQIVTGFQIKNKWDDWIQSIDKQIDHTSNSRYEIFELDDFQTIIHARVQYKIYNNGNVFAGDEELRLFFDANSIHNVENIDF